MEFHIYDNAKIPWNQTDTQCSEHFSLNYILLNVTNIHIVYCVSLIYLI